MERWKQVYIINDKLKIQITFDEVNEKSAVNCLFRDYTEEGVKDSIAKWGIVISPKNI